VNVERHVARSGTPVARYGGAAPPVGGVVLVEPDGLSGGEPPEASPACRTLVNAGFLVVVPDLAWRFVGGGPAADAADLFTDPEVIADIGAARLLLPETAPRFVVGEGAGGLYARLAGCAQRGFDGVVGFGGRTWYSGVSAAHPIQPLDLLPGLACPLQCHFDDDDPAATPAQVDELERRLANGTRPWQVFRYGAGGVGWRGTARATAWSRARAFLLHLAAERS